MFPNRISSEEDVENHDGRHKTHLSNDFPSDLSLHRSRLGVREDFSQLVSYKKFFKFPFRLA